MSTTEYDHWNLPSYDQWEDTGKRWETAFGEAHEMRVRHKAKPSVTPFTNADGVVLGMGTSAGWPAGWTTAWVVDPLGPSPIPLRRETCPYCGMDYVSNDGDLAALVERLDETLPSMMSSYDEVCVNSGCMACMSRIESMTEGLRSFLSTVKP
jgi:hypothetical protein